MAQILIITGHSTSPQETPHVQMAAVVLHVGHFQGIGPVENFCTMYKASLSLSCGQAIRLTMRTSTVDRKVQSAHVNRKRSAVRRLQGLGMVQNPCRIYRRSWSLPIGQALQLKVGRSVSASVGKIDRGLGAVKESC